MKSITNYVRMYVLFAIIFALQACAAANPLAQADTVEQKAYAAYGSFVIVQEQAAKFVSSGQGSRRVVIAIGRAEAQAKAVADPLVDATLEFGEIRSEYEAGGVGQDRFVSSMDNLNNWIERLVPLIGNLKSAVRGADQ